MPDPVVAMLVKAGASQEAQKFAGKLVASAAHEAGEMLADRVRFWRYRAQIRLMERAAELAKKSGRPVSEVPLKVLVPLMEKATLEDDDAMADRWAALLATAATDPDSVLPSFPSILGELAPEEARILEAFHRSVKQGTLSVETLETTGLKTRELASRLGIGYPRFDWHIENLIRLGLLATGAASLQFADPPFRYRLADRELLMFTHLGLAFVEACLPSEEASASEDQAAKP